MNIWMQYWKICDLSALQFKIKLPKVKWPLTKSDTSVYSFEMFQLAFVYFAAYLLQTQRKSFQKNKLGKNTSMTQPSSLLKLSQGCNEGVIQAEDLPGEKLNLGFTLVGNYSLPWSTKVPVSLLSASWWPLSVPRSFSYLLPRGPLHCQSRNDLSDPSCGCWILLLLPLSSKSRYKGLCH